MIRRFSVYACSSDRRLLWPTFLQPPIHHVSSLGELNTSMQDLYDTVVLGKRDDAGLAVSAEWIDVRDLGIAHRLAGEKEAAGGERIIVGSGVSLTS